MTLEILAMHGWAGDSRAWAPWRELARERGWSWTCGERGYGALPPVQPVWSASGPAKRVAIGHSLGPHLLPPEVLAGADAVVLLASFAAFLPGGRAERSLRRGLAGMAAPLEAYLEAHEHEAAAAEHPSAAAVRTMLKAFLAKAADPAPAAALPPGPEADPLTAAGCRRLLEDLHRLEASAGLPEGFPSAATVLVVEAEADRIVVPEAREQLRRALPDAAVLTLPGVGHSLLESAVLARVVGWLERFEAGDG
ncbi:MAG: alpha/beta hydrolase [Synechococcus sp.]|nr:alpha/beta hydrolase [Synechococcus sp.]